VRLVPLVLSLVQPKVPVSTRYFSCRCRVANCGVDVRIFNVKVGKECNLKRLGGGGSEFFPSSRDLPKWLAYSDAEEVPRLSIVAFNPPVSRETSASVGDWAFLDQQTHVTRIRVSQELRFRTHHHFGRPPHRNWTMRTKFRTGTCRRNHFIFPKIQNSPSTFEILFVANAVDASP
jgi:hypothetical protein